MTTLTKYGLLVFVILITIAGDIFNNSSCKASPDDRRGVMQFTAIRSVAAIPVLLIVHFFLNGNLSLHFSWFTVWTAAIFAGLSLLNSVAALFALTCGSLSYSVLLSRCGGLVISAVLGALLWSEAPGVWQYVGLLVLLAAMYFGANPKKDKSITAMWLFLMLLAVIGGGFSGVIQKVHQSNAAHQAEMTEFLMITFLFMGITAWIISLFFKPAADGMKFSLFSKDTRNSVLSGFTFSGLNLIMLALVAELPSMILFPVFNGAVVVLTAVASILIFREKLTKQRLWGLVLGVISIVLLVL